jgi:hypothetical protein
MLQREQSWEELARLEALAASQPGDDDKADGDLRRSLRDTIDWYRQSLARKERFYRE